jgi:hypothetical protein
MLILALIKNVSYVMALERWMKMSKTELLCARPKYVKSDFVWKYYPLIIAGGFASVCVVSIAAILIFVK